MFFAIIFAFVFFGLGQYEARDGSKSNGLLWACISMAMSWLVLSVLHGGDTFYILSQVAVFAGIGVFRVLREP